MILINTGQIWSGKWEVWLGAAKGKFHRTCGTRFLLGTTRKQGGPSHSTEYLEALARCCFSQLGHRGQKPKQVLVSVQKRPLSELPWCLESLKQWVMSKLMPKFSLNPYQQQQKPDRPLKTRWLLNGCLTWLLISPYHPAKIQFSQVGLTWPTVVGTDQMPWLWYEVYQIRSDPKAWQSTSKTSQLSSSVQVWSMVITFCTA